MTSEAAQAGADTRPPIGADIRAFLELLGLCGLAFTQPTLDLVRRNAVDVLIVQGLRPLEVWTVALAIVLLPAFALWVVEGLVSVVAPSSSRAVHRVLLAALAGIWIWEFAQDQFVTPTPLAAGAAAAAATYGLVRLWPGFRSYLRILAAGTVAFMVLFVASASVRPLATPGKGVEPTQLRLRQAPRIVMVVLDELPERSLLNGAGGIEGKLFPNFAALAATSTWFRNTTTVAPFSQAAVPAIVTGRYPARASSLPIARDFPVSIFRLLGGTYRVNAQEASSEQLCPRSICPATRSRSVAGRVGAALQAAAELWRDSAVRGVGSGPVCACATTLGDQLPVGQRFVRSLRKAERPQFDYLHMELPHAPWRYLRSGQTYEQRFQVPQGLDPTTIGWTSADAAALSRQRHLLQLQATDRQLGMIMQRLRAIGAWQKSLVVVTADHGVAFTNGRPYRVADKANYDQIAWVPLFVKLPTQVAPVVDDRAARTIDIVPTIADALDIQIPWPTDGRSLLGAPYSEPNLRLLRWPSSSAFVAPSKTEFETFDRAAGFKRTIAASALRTGERDPSSIFAVGGDGDLIGRDPSSLVGPAPRRQVLAMVTNSADYKGVNPYSNELPAAMVIGGLSGTQQYRLAVSLNGRIAAVGPTTPSLLGSPSFRFVLDTRFLVAGQNTVDLYIVRAKLAGRRLEPVRRVG